MKAKHFKLEELVHPSYVEKFGERAWQFLDPLAVQTLDQMRERFGQITVNNYLWGGPRQFSGLRPMTGGPGAPFSLHRFGRAFDCVFRDTNPIAVFDAILKDPTAFPHIRRLEDARATKTWLHFDTANTGQKQILIFQP